MSSTAPFRVRVRLPTSKQETLTLQRPVTIKSLLEGIQPFVNVELNQIGIKIAYPSKVVELGGPESWDREVKDVGINSGESLVITIQENDTSTTAATTQPSTSFAATDLSGGRVSTPVQKPSTAMEEPISVQPVKLRTTTFDSMTAEKRPSNLSPSNTSSPAKRSKGPSVQDEPPEVEIEGGTIVLRIMEDDNSCMFNALIYCVGKGVFTAKDLRQIVVAKIREDPVRFDAATLGRTVDEYCAWISRPNSWGGEIELAVLSEHFQIGIDCVDVKTGHVFSYGESCPTRCILIYSGIHYDSLAYTFIPSMPDADITVHQILPPSEPDYSTILKGAKQMAQKLKERGYHVDTATFNIVCEQCGRGFKGEKEAVTHAEETGHTAFGQIPTEED